MSLEYGDGGTPENSTDENGIYNLQSEYWLSTYADASGICSQIPTSAN